MFNNMLCHSAIVQKPPMVDDGYGNEVPDYDNAVEIKLKCRIYYQSSSINIDNNQSLTTKGQYYLSCNSFQFGKFDRVVWKEYTFSVDGETIYRYSRSKLHHVTVPLVTLS